MHPWYVGLASGVALVAFGVLAPASAEAHPFGDPQTVVIQRDVDRAEVVQVRWKVGGLDDLTVLGVALGVLPRDRVMLDGAVFYKSSDAAAIGPSGKFTNYLLQQIKVASGGRDCAGSVQPSGDLATTGVTIDYTCPGPVGEVTVDVRTLTDLNPAYRTLATGPNGERAVYGDGQYSHDWILDATRSSDVGRSAAVQLGAVIGGVLLAAVAALLGVRRFRRRAA